MVSISVDEIIYIHEMIEKRFGVISGIINRGNVEAIANRPETEIDGYFPFDTIFEKTAYVCLRQSSDDIPL